MPLLIPLIIILVAVMYYRYRKSGLTRECRWREDRARGRYVCAFCGAETFTADHKTPSLCLKPDDKA